MKKAAILLSIIVLTSFGCGDKSATTGNQPDESELAARLGDWTLDKEFLLNYIKQLPEAQRNRYDTPLGRAELADIFIGDELFYREAQAKGLETDPDVVKRINDAKRTIMIAAYSEKFIEPEAAPDEAEIHDYYELHADEFIEVAYARAQHVFTKSKERADELMRLVEAGEKLTTIAHKYSEDGATRQDGGDLGFFNPGSYIRGIGFSEVMNDTLFRLEVGEIVGPIKWEKGYSIVRVNERHQDRILPYADVRDKISEKLMRDRITSARLDRVAELMKTYEYTNYMAETAEQIERSPEELFNYAQTITNPYERVKAYELIIEKYPDDAYVPQAMFMIGFVYAEEIGDPVEAQRVLGRVVIDYPDSDVAESAQWMLDNLGKPMPEFEDIEDLNKKLKDSN